MLISPGVETGDSVTSRDAKVVLTWGFEVAEKDAKNQPLEFADSVRKKFELEQSTSPEFPSATVRYQGPNQTSVLTGLAEGDYYFRVRAYDDRDTPGAWSEPLHVQVAFMPRWQVLSWVVAGFTVVAITVVAILYGHFRREEPNLAELS